MLCYSTNKKINGNILKSKYNTNYRIIRRFIRVVDKLGFKVSDYRYNGNKSSLYLDIIDQQTNQLAFTIRFSDHSLSSWNQIPAGVLIERTDIKYCISDFKWYSKYYRSLDPKDIHELWTNRYYSDVYE